MDYVKHVAEPIRQVAPRTSLRSLKDDWGHITADVLLLSGEVHLSRKPVCVSHPANGTSIKIFLERVLYDLRLVQLEITLLDWYFKKCDLPIKYWSWPINSTSA